MNARSRNLALAGGAAIVVGLVGVNTLMAPTAPPTAAVGVLTEEPAAGVTVPSPHAAVASAAPSPGAPSKVAGGASTLARRSYAIGLQDLPGLPPDAAPGARLELWVTWDPPVTREPRLQKLIGDVVLERTVPGAVPEAPVTVLLSVPAGRVGDLIYADAYGRLSVVLPG
jgi:hypothetical protein